MRKLSAILPVAVAMLAILTAPVLAKSSGGQKSDDDQASAPCSAYEQAPDGSWRQLPCQEIGGQRQQRSRTRGGDDN